jgi:hypothetical protein
MRLLYTLPALALLLGARVSDAHRHGPDSHKPDTHGHDHDHDHGLKLNVLDTRELLDICANINVNLAADLGILGTAVHLGGSTFVSKFMSGVRCC